MNYRKRKKALKKALKVAMDDLTQHPLSRSGVSAVRSILYELRQLKENKGRA